MKLTKIPRIIIFIWSASQKGMENSDRKVIQQAAYP